MDTLHTTRLNHLCQELTRDGLSQMIICDPLSIWYFTGVRVSPGERLYALYVNTNGNHKLILNRLFTVPHTGLTEIWMSDTDDGMEILAAEVDGTADMGIDKNWPARFLLALMEKHPDVRYQNASCCVDRIRAIKDSDERDKMRAASRINDACMEKASAFLKEGKTEKEVAAYIDHLYQEAGCEGNSFPTIVSYGAHAADPHHEPDDTPLKAGDCIVIDMGCIKDGYCSDMTRTFFCQAADEKYAAIHDLVREANEKAESIIRPGVRFCDIDRTAREHIAAGGYGEYFTHRLGHSIGLEDHEFGDVSSVNTDCVQAGMTFSIEPGVYLPGKFGVRVEDLVFVTEDGCEILNQVEKKWRIV
ncbi:MAG: Xaa-Pro peptidase family protein [Lachnospiraceae bacterium]|nr:Xaa-Pro peptidase family protein [Lachnospiraceae bacterium]